MIQEYVFHLENKSSIEREILRETNISLLCYKYRKRIYRKKKQRLTRLSYSPLLIQLQPLYQEMLPKIVTLDAKKDDRITRSSLPGDADLQSARFKKRKKRIAQTHKPLLLIYHRKINHLANNIYHEDPMLLPTASLPSILISINFDNLST